VSGAAAASLEASFDPAASLLPFGPPLSDESGMIAASRTGGGQRLVSGDAAASVTACAAS
jgi:hypothetical protein